MPSDANGVYSLPSGYEAVTGETIQASQHNPPLEDLASSMSARLMRSGASPMTGALKIVDGSVGSPSVQFANGSSTGFYKTTNGIGVSVGGTKVAEFATGGLVSGGISIGMLLPFVGSTLPPRTVFPYGQTLDRTTYADLWEFAQDEIAAGHTFFNNGNGSTTFGIGDLRGRVMAGRDNMGGSAANVLTNGFTGSALSVGAFGGNQSYTLTTDNLPPYTPAGTISGSAATKSKPYNGTAFGPGTTGFRLMNGLGEAADINDPTTISGTLSGTPQGGTSTPFSIVQPTMIVNFVLYAGA